MDEAWLCIGHDTPPVTPQQGSAIAEAVKGVAGAEYQLIRSGVRAADEASL